MKRIAENIVAHFEQRLEVLEGKAMIVCMSRRICINLYGSWCVCAPAGTTTMTTREASRW